MKAVGRYDTDTYMFIQDPGPPNMEYLCFLRALAEQGHLEHAVAGPVIEGGEALPERVATALARARLGVLIYSV